MSNQKYGLSEKPLERMKREQVVRLSEALVQSLMEYCNKRGLKEMNASLTMSCKSDHQRMTLELFMKTKENGNQRLSLQRVIGE